MLASYVIGTLALVAVLLMWLGVQLAWRRVFHGVGADPDALAGRTSCHGCEVDAASCGKSTGGCDE